MTWSRSTTTPGAAGTASDSYRSRGETVLQDETDVARLAQALPHTGRLGMLEDDRHGIADALLPVVREIADQRAAEELRDFADLIDRGPTFPLPPSIFSAMARERAVDVAAALRGEAGR